MENGLLLNRTIAERLEYHKVPGVSLAVTGDPQIEWARGYGILEPGSSELVTPNTLFQAGSEASQSRPWGKRSKTYNTCIYKPLEAQAALDEAVHWALGLPKSFLITAGDMQLLSKVLDAAHRFEARPSDAEMTDHATEFDIQPIWA